MELCMYHRRTTWFAWLESEGNVGHERPSDSVHGYHQIDGVDIFIDRMRSAPVMAQCSNDEIVSKKASGDCDISDEKSWVQAHDFEFSDVIAVSRFERKR